MHCMWIDFILPENQGYLMQWGMFLRGPSIIFNNIYMYLIINYGTQMTVKGLWVFHLYAVNGALYIKSPLNSIIQGTGSTNKKKKRRSTSSQPSGIWRMYFNAKVLFCTSPNFWCFNKIYLHVKMIVFNKSGLRYTGLFSLIC